MKILYKVYGEHPIDGRQYLGEFSQHFHGKNAIKKATALAKKYTRITKNRAWVEKREY